LRKRIREDYYGTFREAKASRSGKSKTLPARDQRLYTYAAEVIKVVDADTQDIEIDKGFKSRQEHRIRLRGINCPEMSEPEGREARAFVERELAKCVVERPLFKGRRAARPLVVVKTFKAGMFGRYIVDLYYLPGESDPEVIAKQGKLLNQVLVDKGFARKR
jgi:endonuclease YncB( thermonuclease family)